MRVEPWGLGEEGPRVSDSVDKGRGTAAGEFRDLCTWYLGSQEPLWGQWDVWVRSSREGSAWPRDPPEISSHIVMLASTLHHPNQH